ncbi:hypothetical protein QNI16_38285 [Cytophagaceae bacterium YF14B1]|uniref:Uncharacterized protein n=1 Tax=Xanthocytophaga flava TaxID=3048013 RepID=A0AAE3QVV3_9BACT|nr:hypothetical protein [Xanthocytophaga flavus]MDJ1486390.1 hypothetical protein [Xanthocytophaga flavus]
MSHPLELAATKQAREIGFFPKVVKEYIVIHQVLDLSEGQALGPGSGLWCKEAKDDISFILASWISTTG